MKILFCQTQFKMGGQQKVLLTIAKELMKKHDVTIYFENHTFYDLSNFNTVRPSRKVQLENFVKSAIGSVKKMNFKKKIFVDNWHLKNVNSTLIDENFDVVILLNPYILFVDEIAKLLSPKKIVCWTHNIYENYTESCFKDEKEMLFKSMKTADQIVSLEQYTASKWAKINTKTIIIHNPVTIDSNVPILNKNSKKVSFVGRLQYDSKGLDFLCEIAKLIDDDYIISVAGSGKKKDENMFRKKIKELSIENKIELKGQLSGEELKKHYADSKIFLMTSRYEGFPLVAVEAMSMGLPIVGYNIPALQEVTDNGKYGKLFNLGNTVDVANFINNLMTNEKALLELSESSKRRVESFSIESIIMDWEEKVLKEI